MRHAAKLKQELNEWEIMEEKSTWFFQYVPLIQFWNLHRTPGPPPVLQPSSDINLDIMLH